MGYKWELISKCDGEDTVRLKVIGGWLVKHENYNMDDGNTIASCMKFVPDPNHEWVID